MGSWLVLVAVVFIFMVMGGPYLVIRLVEGRRKFLLEMRQEEARIAEAETRRLEVEQKRVELEYREALLELEQFDRRQKPPGLPGSGSPEPEDTTS